MMVVVSPAVTFRLIREADNANMRINSVTGVPAARRGMCYKT